MQLLILDFVWDEEKFKSIVMLYHYFFIAIAVFSFIWKSSSLVKAIKEKNSSKIKAELFILLIMVLVVLAVIGVENHYIDK